MTGIPECGTYGGYQRHKRLREERCDPCKAANRDYKKQWREDHPDADRRLIQDQQARDRALRQLAAMHPGQFRVLYEEELRKQRNGTP